MTFVSRNPFAREEIHRERITNASVSYAILSCDYCGQSDRPIYRYRTESDGGRVSIHRGRFCSKACHDSYHN